MLVFALSITPTIVFHNLFAQHQDTVRKISANSEHEQVGNQTINCHCDHIVAESPFTGTTIPVLGPAPIAYDLFRTEKPVHYIAALITLHDLRGPPAI